MPGFEAEKRIFLEKTDKSRKGSVDKQIRKLMKHVNSHPDYYTTSSCAGRILLMEISKTGRKDDAKFIFAAHRKVLPKEIIGALMAKTKNIVRLQQQNVILHIACRDIDSATKILSAARDSGFMQSGIIPLRKVVVEIKNPDGISMIVKKGKSILLDESYLKIACKEMNDKLEQNYKRINKLLSSLKKRM